MEKKCFIAGLPDAGKTTYIAALWDIIRMREKEDLELMFTTSPENGAYLNEIWGYWVKMKKIERSNTPVPDDIKINVKRKTDEEELVLDIPDFMGEQFQSIINRKLPDNISEWIGQCDRMLFLINKLDGGNKDDMEEDGGTGSEVVDRAKEKATVSPLAPEKMMQTSQNLMILKYIATHSKIKKVAIGLSAWDSKMKTKDSPEVYLQKRSPVLYNFIKYHFSDRLFFGVSAQGFDYVKDASKKDEMRDKQKNCDRAFIVYDKEELPSPDLTRPLNFLIS